MKKWVFILLFPVILLVISSCSSRRNVPKDRTPQTAMEWVHHLFDTSGVHSGLLVIEADSDPHTTTTIVDFHSHSLFTPASNTKILTLYSSLKYLDANLTGLKYLIREDTTWIKGTGDPGFLDPRFKSDSMLSFLKNQKKLVFVSDWSPDDRWGNGWSWDDYPYYYSGQISPMPVYGNMVRAWCHEGKWNILPATFIQNQVSDTDYFRVKREETSNIFQLNSARCTEDTLRIPFVWNPEVVTTLLGDTIGQKVGWTRSLQVGPGEKWQPLPGSERDTLLRSMMYVSDNMIAEQMLMNISSDWWDTISTSRLIDSLMVTDFSSWKDKINWVDGSGLSIYNKFSPRFLVDLLQRLYHSMPFDRLVHFFPAGGIRGTISSWYGDGDQPYVFAKTGTLSGVHCLSGFLKADSGKVFIFSFMHNNYLGSSNQYKERMQTLLEFIKENY